MKIARVKIRQLMGIEELEFEAGKLTVIAGGNGTGKTSILEIIGSALSGGTHDPKMVRVGAEKGDVCIELDDGMKIVKTISEKGASFSVKDADGNEVKKPATFLSSILDQISSNPVEFLTAKPKDRARVLLEAMPIEADRNELRRLTAGLENVVPNSLEGLDLIDSVHQAVYDKRTTVNVLARDKEGAAKQLRSAIGDENPEQIQAQINEAFESENIAHAALKGVQGDLGASELAEVTAIENQIKEIERKANEDILKLQAEIVGVQGKYNTLHAERTADLTRTINEAKVLRTQLQERKTLAVKAEKAREDALKAEQDAEELKLQSEAMTATLDAIKKYRNGLIENLPIQGLEVVNGDVYRDGVQFDKLNTAQKVDIAIQIASLRAKGLPIARMDGFECLDPETWSAFQEAAVASNMQLFVTRVTDGPLKTEALN